MSLKTKSIQSDDTERGLETGVVDNKVYYFFYLTDDVVSIRGRIVQMCHSLFVITMFSYLQGWHD